LCATLRSRLKTPSSLYIEEREDNKHYQIEINKNNDRQLELDQDELELDKDHEDGEQS
jgi:hypothetical protein